MGIPLALTIFGVLVLAVILVGLNSVTGVILAYVASTLLIATWVKRWRRPRRFIILMAAGGLGLFVLGVFYGLVFDFVAAIGYVPDWQRTLLEIFHVIVSILMTFVCPVCFLAGLVGTVALVIRERKPAEETPPGEC